MIKMRAGCLMLCIVTLATLMSRKRSVLCQGHFKPMMHPRAHPQPLPQPHHNPHHLPARNVYTPGARHQIAYHQTPMVANKGLVGSLGGRGQSYLNQAVQQHQARIQQHQPHAPPRASDRRASAPSLSAAANQLFPSMAPATGHPVPFANNLKTQEGDAQRHPRQQQQVINSDQGKLLICYYTTKKTAPYWPKDAREFVVPADRLNQVVSSFSQQQGMNSRTTTTTSGFSAAADRFSPREPDSGQQQQQQHSAQSIPLSLGAANARHNQEARTIKHHNQPQLNSFAGGRMIVVAPKFVPFNRTTTSGSIQMRVVNEPAMVPSGPELSPPSLAQMFFMPNNEQHQRHNTIANRQDNAASFTTTTSATNQPPPPPPGQSMAGFVVPQMANSIVVNNDDLGGKGGGVVVFDKTPRGNKQQHDLNSERNDIDAGGPPPPPPPLTIVNQESRTKTNLPHQHAMLVGNQNNGQQRPPANANNYHQQHLAELASQMEDQQQQLIYSSSSSSQPSMSRTFIVGSSVASPLQATSQAAAAAADSGQDQLLGLTVPLMNGDNGDYYYYYNQLSGSSQRGAGGSSASGPTAATTPYRPVQQQKGKSLQVAGGEISPAPAPTSSLPPLTFVESPPGSPPSHPLGGNPGHQSRALDRLIVSNGPPSTSVRHPQQQQQQYSSPTVSASSSQTTSFASTSDLLEPAAAAAATGDDGLISSGTKTTPIASVASPSSSASSPSVASQHQHQLIATLPSSLLISYPPLLPASIAPAQPLPPNGSSTAATASLTTKAQMSAGNGGSMANSDADTAATTTTNGNNRHHHHQHNNRQIVGVGGNSLSATLVSSPLSTMFDVFGAASQYLMRFKPSSLISPSSFASLNSIVGDASGHHHNSRSNSSSSPLVSLPFASGILGGSSSSHHKSNTSDSGFLSRLSLETHQRREDICGRTIQTPERRIIGGEGAKYGEFPYQVHIKIAKHQCGGALIDKQSIVTAAHCVYHFITRAPVSKLQIVIGAYDIEDEQYQELPPQYFKVNRVKLHPNFRFSASHPDRYDIAILKLDKPVKYTDNVLPVCLPGKDLRYENMVGTVTGFGKTDPSLSNRYGTRLLQKVDVPIIENGECERWHRTRGIDLKIFPEMMCAGYEDGLKDACVGDSGGPLVVKTPVGSNGSFRWTLAGITSAGFGCAQSRQPGIYHRVSHTVDWILDNLD